MTVCIFQHVQWRWALNDRLAPGYLRRQLVETLAVDAARRWHRRPVRREGDLQPDLAVALAAVLAVDFDPGIDLLPRGREDPQA